MEQEAEIIKERIARLRKEYENLRAICGPRAISSETINRYADEIKELESKLNA